MLKLYRTKMTPINEHSYQAVFIIPKCDEYESKVSST